MMARSRIQEVLHDPVPLPLPAWLPPGPGSRRHRRRDLRHTPARARQAPGRDTRSGTGRETRSTVASALGALGCPVIPTETNFVMAALGRDAGPVIEALGERGVQVGRRFPSMPKHLRVTLGTPSEMETFLNAFRAVIA